MQEIKNYLLNYDSTERVTLLLLSKEFNQQITFNSFPELKEMIYKANTKYREKIARGRKDRNNTRMKKRYMLNADKREKRKAEKIKEKELEFNRYTTINNLEWKSVDGFGIKYLVSNTGLIYNRETLTYVKQHKSKSGYINCNLNDRYQLVHRIIAKAFIPNPENKAEVNHINGKKDDNRIENLEWATHQENVKHSFEILGRKSNFFGKKGRYGKQKGYSYCKHRNKYISQATVDGKTKYLGAFDTAKEAKNYTSKYKKENNIPDQRVPKGYTESNGKFIAQVNHKGKVTYLGVFKTKEEAIEKTKEFKKTLI